MKPRIYVETSVISYLAARPSTDAVNAARQYHSMQLWLAKSKFDLSLSTLVIDEMSEGNETAVIRRLDFAKEIALVTMPDNSAWIADALVASKALPEIAYADGLHIACAAILKFDVIASWNFRHIASIWARNKIIACLNELGVHAPTIATPEEILESFNDQHE